jgi:hypothetical protein
VLGVYDISDVAASGLGLGVGEGGFEWRGGVGGVDMRIASVPQRGYLWRWWRADGMDVG